MFLWERLLGVDVGAWMGMWAADRRKNRIEHFDELHKAKELWEKARLKSLRAADREPMIAKIYGLIQGHLSEVE